MATFRSVEIFAPGRDQRSCGLTCEDLLSIAHRLSLLSGLVRPKSGPLELPALWLQTRGRQVYTGRLWLFRT
jgi:hypothetical protein